jgi:hypothetical protein
MGRNAGVGAGGTVVLTIMLYLKDHFFFVNKGRRLGI